MDESMIDILKRIDSKLDTLLAALLEEQEDEDASANLTLDGERIGAERDQSAPL